MYLVCSAPGTSVLHLTAEECTSQFPLTDPASLEAGRKQRLQADLRRHDGVTTGVCLAVVASLSPSGPPFPALALFKLSSRGQSDRMDQVFDLVFDFVVWSQDSNN